MNLLCEHYCFFVAGICGFNFFLKSEFQCFDEVKFNFTVKMASQLPREMHIDVDNNISIEVEDSSNVDVDTPKGGSDNDVLLQR